MHGPIIILQMFITSIFRHTKCHSLPFSALNECSRYLSQCLNLAPLRVSQAVLTSYPSDAQVSLQNEPSTFRELLALQLPLLAYSRRSKGKGLRVIAPNLKGLQPTQRLTLVQIDALPQNLAQSWTFAAPGSGVTSYIKAGAILCFCMSDAFPLYVRNDDLSLVLRPPSNSP